MFPFRAAVAAVMTAGALAVPSMGPSSVTVTIDSAHPAGRLPGDFTGLSFEMRELGIGNLDPARGNTAALMRTLGPSNLRIAGNTLDRDTLWVPDGQPVPDPLPEWVRDVVRPADIRRLDALLRATGWRTEVGINVGRWDAALGADQAAAMTRILGRRLVAVECGNEPDQWAGKALRPAGYAYPDYHADWLACADAVGHDRIAGPDTAGTSSDWAASLARDEHQRMAMLTVHQYSAPFTLTLPTLSIRLVLISSITSLKMTDTE